jgi:energy-coupling factor transporter ATP-binding protein EcfA2
MKLKCFSGADVYGYLNFRIDFNSDLSFLVGVNGSGKTTVLRLIQALLTPALRELVIIPFSEISVTFEDKGRESIISSRKTLGQLELFSSETQKPLILPLIDQDEIEVISSHEERARNLFEEYQVKYSGNEVFQFISKLSAPIILGLERTQKSLADLSYGYERERLFAANTKQSLRARRIIRGSLAAGLMETQVMVRDTYRRLRLIEGRHSERLRESILLSAFRYYDFSFLEKNVKSLVPDWVEQKQILERKAEINTALSKIGLSGDKITNVLETFFQRLEGLFASMGKIEQSKGVPIEWVINKAQIDRVSDLIQVIDVHRSEVDKLFAPISKFLESINSFYMDTGKSLSIDTVGQLKIQRPDKTYAPVEALSSGERQLLIMFAHLIFNEFENRSNVFIIDEPELSLHLKWQERFVTKAIEVSPKTQLILATHSPEIIAGYEQRSITI